MTIVVSRAAGTVERERRSPVDRARAVQNAQNAFRTSSLDGAQNAPPTRPTRHPRCEKRERTKNPTPLQWRPSLMEAVRQH